MAHPPKDDATTLWWESSSYRISLNQALWYRLASGDTNAIHVNANTVPRFLLDDDDNSSNSNNNKKPLLHGLCTLGIAARMIAQQWQKQQQDPCCAELSLRQLEGSFVKPVWVGDQISVRVWKRDDDDHRQSSFYFEVYNDCKKEVCLKNGYLLLMADTLDGSSDQQPHSRL